MKLKDKSAFPVDRVGYAAGMTYREWLTGQIASGQDLYDISPSGIEIIAESTIELANEIIKQLENESN